MNTDDSDFFIHVPKQPANIALDLIKGLDGRTIACARTPTARTQHRCAGGGGELFAEDELVRKKCYDEMRCEMPGQPRSTFLMVFSPDGSKVASTHGNHNIYITDIKSGKNVKILTGHPRTPWCIAFHPTSNQIVASGCLGGEVRIWDLSGGSEVWTTGNQSVIASIAFHPNDRVLVIATFNELYFWDWSRPEPFVQISTANPKEKIRYVAFDRLGHKLITGIANSPQTRWERVRAPVPVPRQAERSASPYRLRITSRLVNESGGGRQDEEQLAGAQPIRYVLPSRNEVVARLVAERQEASTSSALSSVPERERRITASYRNLLQEYERLVQRYLKIYKPPTMIDRGTDPMEPAPVSRSTSSSTQAPDETAEPGPSQPILDTSISSLAGASSSQQHQQSLVMPSRLVAMKKQTTTLGTATQTQVTEQGHSNEMIDQGQMNDHQNDQSQVNDHSNTMDGAENVKIDQKKGDKSETGDSRKHKSSEIGEEESSREKRSRCDVLASTSEVHVTEETQSEVQQQPASLSVQQDTSSNSQAVSQSSQPTSPKQLSPTSHAETATQTHSPRKLLIISEKTPPAVAPSTEASNSSPGLTIKCTTSSTSNASKSSDLSNSSNTVVEPQPGTSRDGPSSSRSDEPSTSTGNRGADLLSNLRPIAEDVRNRFLPIIKSLPACDRPRLLRRFESSRAHERLKFRHMLRQHAQMQKKPNQHHRRPVLDTTSDSSSSDDDRTTSAEATPSTAAATATTTHTNTNISGVRNFIMDLEQLFMTVLLTEIEISNETNARNSTEQGQEDGSGGANRTLSNDSTTGGIPGDERSTRAPSAVGGSFSFRNYPPRRRLFSHRGSAFMPTRVHYNRAMMQPTSAARYRRGGSGRVFGGAPRLSSSALPHATFAAADEVIDYAQRPDAEDLPHERMMEPGLTSLSLSPEQPTSPPPPLASTSPPPPPPRTSQQQHPSNISLGTMYSSIVHDLESSLNDVRNIRASIRPAAGETSDMLATFSASLENIMNQSDAILTNLGGSMSMLPANLELGANAATNQSGAGERNAAANQSGERNAAANQSGERNVANQSGGEGVRSTNATTNQNVEQRPSATSSVIETDHNYQRHDSMSPLMTSLHMTISYIQRQARLLRQQVDSIERIDRAMFEVEQLQLIRQLVMEFLRLVRSSGGNESSRSSAGMSSVRQMMAGTRISDSDNSQPTPSTSASTLNSSAANPNSSRNTSTNPASNPSTNPSANPSTIPATNASTNPSANPPTTSAGTTTAPPAQAVPRTARFRKMYPPSRLLRLQRNSRRSLFINCMPRRNRCLAANALRRSMSAQAMQNRMVRDVNSPLNNLASFAMINATNLSLMVRRLETLLNQQSQVVIRAQQSQDRGGPPTSSSTATNPLASHAQPTDPGNGSGGGATFTSSPIRVGERILSIRLNDCVLRMNRILNTTRFRTIRTDNVIVPQQDGVRYGARHSLSVIVDSMSKHLDELTGIDMSQSMRTQLHNVFAMALLLCDLLLWELVEAMPPPAVGMNLDAERATLSGRIVHLCGQMLQNRCWFSVYSQQLWHNLQHVRIVMRHANRAMMGQQQQQSAGGGGGGYTTARRNAMMAPSGRQENARRVLLRRYLRNLNSDSGTESTPPTPSSAPSAANADATATTTSTPPDVAPNWNTLRYLVMRYSYDNDDEDDQMANNSSSNNRGPNYRSNRISNDSPGYNNSGQSYNNSSGQSYNNSSRQSYNNSSGQSYSNRGQSYNNSNSNNQEQNEPIVLTPPHPVNVSIDDISSDNDEELYNNSSESGGGGGGASSVPSGGGGSLYRTNNVNLVREESNSRSWNVPTVQINDVPISGDHPYLLQPSQPYLHQHPRHHRTIYRSMTQTSHPPAQMRPSPQISVLRPRFLHPLYGGAGLNPFDAELQEERGGGGGGEASNAAAAAAAAAAASYDCDIITTVTPNHRIQVWDVGNGNIPSISNPLKNIIVSECKIHNDASVDIARDGTILVTLLPSGGYINVTNKLGVYSLKWDSLGQCLYTTTFEQNAVSVSLSPLSRHLVVGLASRRVSIVPSERWTMARIFFIDQPAKSCRSVEAAPSGGSSAEVLPVLRELAQNRDGRQATNYKSVNCIRWLPTSGQGLIYATNTGQLVILT